MFCIIILAEEKMFSFDLFLTEAYAWKTYVTFIWNACKQNWNVSAPRKTGKMHLLWTNWRLNENENNWFIVWPLDFRHIQYNNRGCSIPILNKFRTQANHLLDYLYQCRFKHRWKFIVLLLFLPKWMVEENDSTTIEIAKKKKRSNK